MTNVTALAIKRKKKIKKILPPNTHILHTIACMLFRAVVRSVSTSDILLINN